MDIVQKFYDDMASNYDKLFADWQATTKEQADIIDKIFNRFGLGKDSNVLDCACGIGTQAIGLARLGYNVWASDLSEGELQEAKNRAEAAGVEIDFRQADFCKLAQRFERQFEAVIAMDNALPHMLSVESLKLAVESMIGRIKQSGLFVASIRDYDAVLEQKPAGTSPYIHKVENGQRISFQTWDWNDDRYKLVQYIIEDTDRLTVNKYECEYRATKREEITNLLLNSGCSKAEWLFPDETGFYQPIVVAVK